MDFISASEQAKLMRDPKVQEAMKAAGDKALNDSAVQQAIIDAAKKNLTAENAQAVASKVKDWATDPETQAAARHYAGMAMAYAGTASAAFVGVIEQGPGGVRLIAFFTSLGSVALSIFFLIHIHAILNFIGYLVAVYQLLFALTTMLFEAKPEWIQKIPGLDKYQNMLIHYAKFLTVMGGRGAFYIFQGCMWLMATKNLLEHFFYLIVGCLQILCGLLCALMHFGIMPSHVTAKAKQLAGSYTKVPEGSSA